MSDKPISPAGERRARIGPPVERCVAFRECGVYCTPTVVVSSFKNVLKIGPRIRFSRPDGGTARCNAFYNTFKVQRYLTSAQSHRALRTAAMSTWPPGIGVSAGAAAGWIANAGTPASAPREQRDLAEASKVSLPSIKRLETNRGPPWAQARTIEAMRAALEAGGVEFIAENGGGPGVRLRFPSARLTSTGRRACANRRLQEHDTGEVRGET